MSFHEVTKSYTDTAALRGVSLDVPRGTFFGLVGMNGAGKTTLIKCLLDTTRPDSGHISVFGESSRTSSARRALAFLPERFMAPFYATGRDFLRFMGRLYGQEPNASIVSEMLDRLDLKTDALDKPIRSYSKGMTQKLGLAACLLAPRPLLVLDEPTSGLDPKARARLKQALRDRQREGATILMTSHSLADVSEMCDSMAILHRGALAFTGSPRSLLAEEGGTTLEEAFLHRIDRQSAASSTT